MAAPENLKKLQRRMFALITSPKGAAGAYEELVREDPGAAPLTAWVKGSDVRAAAARVQRYANMYFYRLLEILRQDYPYTERVLGAERFEEVARDYLTASPSEWPSVRHVGGRLPQFLREAEPAQKLLSEFPYLSDLAALEWARSDVFDNAEVTALTPQDLSAFDPEEWGALRFETIPSLRLVHLDWPVQEIWLAAKEEKPLPEMGEKPVALVVWRKDFKTWHRLLAPEEAGALEALQEGTTFGEICAALAGEDEDLEETARKAAEALARWVQEGLLYRVSAQP